MMEFKKRLCRKAAIIIAGMMATGVSLASANSNPSHSEPKWVDIGEGIQFSMVRAYRYCRKGQPDMALVRISPANVAVHAHYFRAHGAQEPMTLAQWQRITGSLVIFNGSQYYPDLRPMGWFIQEGRNHGTAGIKQWKGLLAAHPLQDGLPAATVIDMEEHPYTLQSLPYKMAVQSLMLLDARGNVRTRKSDWIANRTTVAEDHQGRILVICTEGGYTLWELAMLLQEGSLEIKRAMVMDGGFETQLAVRSESFSYTLLGQWSIGDPTEWPIPGLRRSLPTVISIDPIVKKAADRPQ
jgi:uncharacterized protein YigE (DUF2233 family)